MVSRIDVINGDAYMSTKLIIGGDTFPGPLNRMNFVNGNANLIFNNLLEEINTADFFLINLEAPLIEKTSPIKKSGPVLSMNEACLNGLVNSKVKAVNLANNHILDHGEQGLKNTLQKCKEAGLLCVGAGKNLEEAGEPLVVKINNLKVCFVAMADLEFSIAGKESWGANPTDIINFSRLMRNKNHNWDIVIVLLHEGVLHYPYPTPRLQKLCRFFIEEGASAVICQHSHCPGCYEYYLDSPIVYGQGDLISEYAGQSQLKGFLVSFTIHGANSLEMETIPYTQQRPQGGVRLLTLLEAEQFNQEIQIRNEVLTDENKLQAAFDTYCELNKARYISNLLGQNRVFRKLDRLFDLNSRIIPSSRIALLLHFIRCSAIREVVINALENINSNNQ
jgi:poly-gamma-glutamate synthesis protein (capsule biosynthesis protein)